MSDIRSSLQLLAPLLRYPDASYAERVSVAREVVRGLETFADEMAGLDLPRQQTAYTATFDLAPSCSPYLGIHLFGDESADRARLMVGLRMSYRRAGDGVSAELPDHIAEVMGFASRFDEEEWRDLVPLVLAPALARMDELLRPTSNPYRHLIAAARHLSQTGGAS